MDAEAWMLQLLHALQALAQPAQVQVELYPEFVCHGDELVIEYGEALDGAKSTNDLTSGQIEALNELDRFLIEHSGKRHEELYLTPEGLVLPAWDEIRSRARTALDSFGWPNDVPPSSVDRGNIYVGPN